MFKSVLMASTAFIALAGVATASDLPSKAAPASAPVVSKKNPFDGFYIGIHGGYGSTSVSQFSAVDVDYNSDPIDGLWTDGFLKNDGNGYFGGGQIGANYVTNSGLLMGVELSASVGKITGTSYGDDYSYNNMGSYCSNYCDLDGTFTDTINSMALGQLKLGFASDTIAVYALGGIAVADVSTRQDIYGNSFFNGNFDYENTWSGMRAGWTVGGGIDYMINSNLSVGATYNYVDLGKQSYSDVAIDLDNNHDNGIAVHETDLTAQIVKINLNYHF